VLYYWDNNIITPLIPRSLLKNKNLFNKTKTEKKKKRKKEKKKKRKKEKKKKNLVSEPSNNYSIL